MEDASFRHHLHTATMCTSLRVIQRLVKPAQTKRKKITSSTQFLAPFPHSFLRSAAQDPRKRSSLVTDWCVSLSRMRVLGGAVGGGKEAEELKTASIGQRLPLLVGGGHWKLQFDGTGFVQILVKTGKMQQYEVHSNLKHRINIYIYIYTYLHIYTN